MERRLQVLLDQERYDRVAEEAARRGGSVASVIRDAIDIAYPSQRERQRVALAKWLESTAEPVTEDVTWEESRRAMEAELEARFS